VSVPYFTRFGPGTSCCPRVVIIIIIMYAQNKDGDTSHPQIVHPSICVTGVMFSEGSLEVSRSWPVKDSVPGDEEESIQKTRRILRRGGGSIRYRIFRPRQLHMLPAPLVVLHGGPGVPSNYLLSLVNVITDRTVIFYDQLGCGRSSRPNDPEAYSLESSMDDLHALLSHWKLKQYHLFGHSFGGIIAYEYLYRLTFQQEIVTTEEHACTSAANKSKRQSAGCLSLILASVPTETRLVQEESLRLQSELVIPNDSNNDNSSSSSSSLSITRSQIFSQTHECRVIPTPLPLLDAYAHAGNALWRGASAIPNYCASQGLITADKGKSESQPTCQQRQRLKIPSCVLRGQYDFVTNRCVEGWHDLLENIQYTVLAGCSHHGLLEQERLFGDVIHAFLEDHDL
jgi:pimeloyl-ACP methyl ester carboxylesterase